MLKRSPFPTPLEKRARRIRAAFLVVFGMILLTGLLAVAWTGATLKAKMIPGQVVSTVPHDGQLLFNVPETVRYLLSESDFATLDVGNEVMRELSPESSPFHTQAQLLYWDTEGDIQWLAYLPLVRPHAAHVTRLRNILANSPYIAPINSDDAATTTPLCYYDLRASGLILSSTSLPIDYQILAQPTAPLDGMILKYSSPVGWVPGEWTEIMRGEVDGIPPQFAVTRLEWEKNSESGEISLMARGDHGEELALIAFNPIIAKDKL